MRTVGVFKTNVQRRSKANVILDEIHRSFPESNPTFDLENCDNVLRVEKLNDRDCEIKVKRIVKEQGYQIDNLL